MNARTALAVMLASLALYACTPPTASLGQTTSHETSDDDDDDSDAKETRTEKKKAKTASGFEVKGSADAGTDGGEDECVPTNAEE